MYIIGVYHSYQNNHSYTTSAIITITIVTINAILLQELSRAAITFSDRPASLESLRAEGHGTKQAKEILLQRSC